MTAVGGHEVRGEGSQIALLLLNVEHGDGAAGLVDLVEQGVTVHEAAQQGPIGGAELDQNFKRAASNIPNIDVLPVQGINVYDILRRGTLVLSKAAVEAIEERFK